MNASQTTVRIFLSVPQFAFDAEKDKEVLSLSAFARAALKEGKNMQIIPFQGHPGLFLSEPLVANALDEEGDDALPITLLNGELKLKGRAPTEEELCSWLEMTGVDIDLNREAKIQQQLAMFQGANCGGCNPETAACVACPSCDHAFLKQQTPDGDLDYNF